MVSIAEFFIEFKLKIIIGLIIAAVVGGGVYAWHAKDVKIEKQAEKLMVLKVENGSLKDTAGKVDGAKVITEKTNNDIAVDTAKNHTKIDSIQTHTKQLVQQIEDEHAAEPQTPENVHNTDVETSTVMIAGLWDTYCQSAPGAAACTAPPPTAAQPAATPT